jgi:hypothetical protein
VGLPEGPLHHSLAAVVAVAAAAPSLAPSAPYSAGSHGIPILLRERFPARSFLGEAEARSDDESMSEGLSDVSHCDTIRACSSLRDKTLMIRSSSAS